MAVGLAIASGVACSSGAGANLPLVTPPVEAATPTSLGGNLTRIKHLPAPGSSLSANDFTQRFFTGNGPTDIFTILASIDLRIVEINNDSKSLACLKQEPIAYSLTPFGQTVPFFAQCASILKDPSGEAKGGFVQFGQVGNDTYIYVSTTVGVLAAKLTALPAAAPAGSGGDAGPDTGANISTNFIAEAWLTVGADNATSCGNMSGFDDCSYGAIHLLANSDTKTFDMAVAGLGIGFCGAQLQSDGTTVYGIGSSDMGATCNSTETLCVAATDLTTAGTCGTSLTTFALPAIGRQTVTGTSQTFAASQYPGGSDNAIVLDGTATDSLNFGPTTPTAGVGTI